jgi:alkanesulfonate monooxygenase SsuD/methylene tetrahydromethanopterin reductase-like flavin-dependent oxidoreductase (luciferase family)
LIGGSGEKKTLRLVAQYADACNLFLNPGAEGIQHKLDVLKQHCDAVGRDFGEIEITATSRATPGVDTTEDIIALCKQGAEAGVRHIMFVVPNIYEPGALEILAKDVLPAVKDL